MLRAFFRDSAVYGTAKLLTGGVALLSLPIYTRALGPADYGVVDLLTTVAAIVHVTVALEISQGYGRYVMSIEGQGERSRYASTALWFTVAAYSVFVLAALPLAGVVSVWWFGSRDHATILRVATLVIWSTGLFYLVQNLLRYERRAAAYGVISVLFSVASVGITIVLLLIVNAGLIGVFIGQWVAGACAVALGLWLARDTIALSFDPARLREMLAFSLPLVPSSLGVVASTYVDRYAIVRLLSLDDLGVYGVAFRLASVVGVAMAGLLAAVAPLVYQHHHEPDTPRQIARMFQWFLAITLPLIIFLGLFSPELVRWVAPDAYRAAAPLVVVLGTSILLASCYTFSPGLWIAGRTGRVAAIGLAGGALNFALNFTLIPRLGLIGAGLATTLSAGAACIAHFTFGQRLYRVPFAWGRIAAAAVLAAGTLLVLPQAFPNVIVDSPEGLAVRAGSWLVASAAIGAILIGPSDVDLLMHRVKAAFHASPAARQP